MIGSKVCINLFLWVLENISSVVVVFINHQNVLVVSLVYFVDLCKSPAPFIQMFKFVFNKIILIWKNMDDECVNRCKICHFESFIIIQYFSTYYISSIQMMDWKYHLPTVYWDKKICKTTNIHSNLANFLK